MNGDIEAEYAVLREWAEQFGETPFNALPLATSVAKADSALTVMKRLFELSDRLFAARQEAAVGTKHYNELLGVYCSALTRVAIESGDAIVLKIVAQALDDGNLLSNAYWKSSGVVKGENDV